jgi:hypothetical protein
MMITPLTKRTITVQFDNSNVGLDVFEAPSGSIELKIKTNVMHVIEVNKNGQEILFNGHKVYPEPEHHEA